MKDFFISYNKADRAWAEWIAWILEEEGYSVVIQAWDFRPGENFVLEMHKATAGTSKTIVVLSDNYLNALYTQPEWAAAFSSDPIGHQRQLVPIRVGLCKPTGLLASIIYIDIVETAEQEARLAILGAFSTRAKPSHPPIFPGRGASHHSPVAYPGEGGGEVVNSISNSNIKTGADSETFTAKSLPHLTSAAESPYRLATPPVKRDIPRLLPYLCDRSDQEMELCLALKGHRQQMSRRPFVCVIHGDELECHSEFWERMQHTAIPRSLDLEARHLSVEEYPLQWPVNKAARYSSLQIFWGYLGQSLLQNSAASKEEILEFVALHEKPILISLSLFTEDFLVGGTDLFSAFIKFWNTLPDLPLGRTLIIAMCIKYQRIERMGVFRRWSFRKANERLRRFVQNLVDNPSWAGNVVALTELQAIRRNDVETWIRSSHVRSVCDINERDIRSLYERAELCTPDGHITMEMLAEELKILAAKNRH